MLLCWYIEIFYYYLIMKFSLIFFYISFKIFLYIIEIENYRLVKNLFMLLNINLCIIMF